MTFEETRIPGCVLVRPRSLADDRGRFTKTMHVGEFEAAGLRTDWREEFFTRSRRNVVRGLHFQTPPADHAKLVYCLVGDVLDLVVDLRRGSPSEGQLVSVRLDQENGAGLYIPSGCAHGFLSFYDESLMLYKVTSEHAPDQDAGIAWNSIDFDWPVVDPIVSERDRRHPPLADFVSPFVFKSEDRTR